MLWVVIGASTVWFVILFLDVIFKTCMFHPYLSTLHTCGVNVRPLFISVTLTGFNRSINRMGRYKPKLLKLWFDIGVCATALIFFPSVILSVISISQMLRSTTVLEYSHSPLVPVIPGYNVPLSHFVYYVIVCFFCSVVHEFGHALAASREQVCVENFGFAVFGIFSLAFVNLPADQMKLLSHWRKLRILCAGIWHNIVLALIGLLLWYLVFIFLSPVYQIGRGVSILEINQMSGLNHPAGFEIGDHIYSVGNCQVSDSESWLSCLQHLKNSPPQGFCLLRTFDSNNEELCMNSSEHLSFHSKAMVKNICLKAREAVKTFDRCSKPSDCNSDSICAFPVLPEDHHLISIERYQKPSVLYAGAMDDLGLNVLMSDFIPKFKVFPAKFAECLIHLLQYIIMFSSGLAVLNVLPLFYHDGTYIVEHFMHLCFVNIIPSFQTRNSIVQLINRLGFIMLVSMILCLLKYLIFHSNINFAV